MVEQLFGSKTRVKLLKLFYSNPNRSFYVREITRKVEEQINSVRRELSNMLSLGIISSDKSNNRLYYEVNQKYEHYEPLSQMFGAKSKKKIETSDNKKATKSQSQESRTNSSKKNDTAKGIELAEADKWSVVGNVYGIAYSGAYTRDELAQADIVIIGDVNIAKVEAVIVELEKEKNKELRYAVFDLEEWKYRRQVHDKFYTKFMDTKKQIVLDKDGLFERI